MMWVWLGVGIGEEDVTEEVGVASIKVDCPFN